MSLRSKTITGVSWSAGAKYLSQAFQLGVTVALMRLLPPKVFGLYAMGMVFVAFAGPLKRLGLKSALIQDRDTTQVQESTVFWLLVVIGVSLSLVFVLISPLVSEIYGSKEAGKVITFLSPVIFLGAIGVVPRAFLEKKMRFDYLAMVDVPSVITSGGVALGMAYNGYDVISLLILQNIRAFLQGSLIWIFSSWYPTLQFSFSSSFNLVKYGVNLMGFNIVNKISSYSDELIIGSFLGESQLGIYNRSKRIVRFPISKVASAISDVIFPAMSSVQKNNQKVKEIYIQSTQIISFLIFPAVSGLVIVSENMVISMLGNKWLDAIYVIQLLCVVTFVHVVSYPTGWIYRAKGRTDWMFWWGTAESILRILGISIGVYFGSIESVALAYGITSILTLYPVVTIPGILIGMRFTDVLRAVSGNFIASVVMAIGVYVVELPIPSAWSSWNVLLLQVGTGLFLYWSIAYGAGLWAYRELLGILRERWVYS